MPTRTETGDKEGRRPRRERQGVRAYRQALRKKVTRVLAQQSVSTEDMDRIGREFLRAVERGNPATIEVFLRAGIPVNYRDPQTLQSALHVAAGARARQAVRLLLKTSGCDVLLRDKQGRLPSELAYLFGNDPALARLLGNRERKQAQAQGAALTRKAPPPTSS